MNGAMLKIVEEEKEVRNAQSLFMNKMNSVASKRDVIMVGYKGESSEQKASWSKELGIWWTSEKSENRYWNAFGIGEPKWHTKYSHSITCEINPPFLGINRKASGAFAKDADGKIYLLHRGGIGGGREGIGKTTFQNNYRGEWHEVIDGNVISELALIASLHSPRFAKQVAAFAYEIERIKAMSAERATATAPVPHVQFKEEFHGVKKPSTTYKEIEAKCDHGLVVNKLANCLEELGITVGNTQNIDLFTLDQQGNLRAMIEVKTSTSKTDYYGAIGQLFFHSTKQNKRPRLFAVFPESVDEESKKTLRKLGVECITYRWIDDHPDFGDFKFRALIE
jgi:hypothetical protein